MRGYLVSGCGCPEADAEDIIQDTILVIRRRYWPTVRALDKPEAYWFKIAGNRYRRIRGRPGRPHRRRGPVRAAARAWPIRVTSSRRLTAARRWSR